MLYLIKSIKCNNLKNSNYKHAKSIRLINSHEVIKMKYKNYTGYLQINAIKNILFYCIAIAYYILRNKHVDHNVLFT